MLNYLRDCIIMGLCVSACVTGSGAESVAVEWRLCQWETWMDVRSVRRQCWRSDQQGRAAGHRHVDLRSTRRLSWAASVAWHCTTACRRCLPGSQLSNLELSWNRNSENNRRSAFNHVLTLTWFCRLLHEMIQLMIRNWTAISSLLWQKSTAVRNNHKHDRQTDSHCDDVDVAYCHALQRLDVDGDGVISYDDFMQSCLAVILFRAV